MIKKRLFTPGPVTAYSPGLWAALDANVHHRTPEFRAILSDVFNSLREILGSPDHTFVFGSSGTGAMEAAVTNFFSQQDEVLVASCGKFGERWIEVASRYGLKVKILKYSYGQPVNPDDIEVALREKPGTRGVFVQACESSTGVQNDIQPIGSICSKTEALLIVDGVSGLGTMPLSFNAGIDVLVSGSQKALMIPPGLAFMGVSSKAWKYVEHAHLPRYYFDLPAAKKAWDQNQQTPFTPPTSLIVSLQKSLEAIQQIGLSRLIQLTENRARATRAGLQAISLEMFAKGSPANALTAVAAPNGIADKITIHMKQEFGIQLAGGQGEMKGKIFRIGHMGFIDHLDLIGVLAALELTLKALDLPVSLGSSLQAFQKTFAEIS